MNELEPTSSAEGVVDEFPPGWPALAEHVGSGTASICSVCGSAAAPDDIEDTNGWRWYSDGRGGLHSLCATCPAPTSVSV